MSARPTCAGCAKPSETALGLYDVGTGETDPIHSILQEVRFSLALLGSALKNVEILVEATPLSSAGVDMSIELMIRKLEAAEKIYLGQRTSTVAS